MRFKKCPRCGVGRLYVTDSITVEGISYRRKNCNKCKFIGYSAEEMISHEKYRAVRNGYEKVKRMERERRRESASRGICEAHQEDRRADAEQAKRD
jgi:hypothetical protein